MKKILAVLALLLAFILFLIWNDGPLTGVEMAWLKQHGVIKVAGSNDYPPLNFADSFGNAQGISVDYWRLLADKMDFTVEFDTSVPFKQQLEGLKSGRFDSLTGIFPLAKRAEFFDFSEPYMNVNTYIYVRPQLAHVRGFDDLWDLKVGVVQGDSGQTLCVAAGVKPRAYAKYTDTIHALAQGKLDAIVMDELVVCYIVAKNELEEKVIRAGQSVDQGQMILPVKKGNGILLSILNKGVAAISPEELREISIKWIGSSGMKY